MVGRVRALRTVPNCALNSELSFKDMLFSKAAPKAKSLWRQLRKKGWRYWLTVAVLLIVGTLAGMWLAWHTGSYKGPKQDYSGSIDLHFTPAGDIPGVLTSPGEAQLEPLRKRERRVERSAHDRNKPRLRSSRGT